MVTIGFTQQEVLDALFDYAKSKKGIIGVNGSIRVLLSDDTGRCLTPFGCVKKDKTITKIVLEIGG